MRWVLDARCSRSSSRSRVGNLENPQARVMTKANLVLQRPETRVSWARAPFPVSRCQKKHGETSKGTRTALSMERTKQYPNYNEHICLAFLLRARKRVFGSRRRRVNEVVHGLFSERPDCFLGFLFFFFF